MPPVLVPGAGAGEPGNRGRGGEPAAPVPLGNLLGVENAGIEQWAEWGRESAAAANQVPPWLAWHEQASRDPPQT